MYTDSAFYNSYGKGAYQYQMQYIIIVIIIIWCQEFVNIFTLPLLFSGIFNLFEFPIQLRNGFR